MPVKSGGFLVQSTYGAPGNFEVVVPLAAGLGHFYRDNSAAGFPWHGPGTFGSGTFATASLIESTFGNLEVVAVISTNLLHFFRTPAGVWSAPTLVTAGVTGSPGFIQSTYGAPGNFEVVVPLAGGGLGHFYRDNSALGFPWHGPTAFGGNGGFFAASLIESTFGNLELLAMIADSGTNSLLHFFRVPGKPWSAPLVVTNGLVGVPGFIQSTYGVPGNFEVVVPLAGGGLGHYFRDNSDPDFRWHGPVTFGSGKFDAASLIESTFGNLDLVAEDTSSNLMHFYRVPGAAWTGPSSFAQGATVYLRPGSPPQPQVPVPPPVPPPHPVTSPSAPPPPPPHPQPPPAYFWITVWYDDGTTYAYHYNTLQDATQAQYNFGLEAQDPNSNVDVVSLGQPIYSSYPPPA